MYNLRNLCRPSRPHVRIPSPLGHSHRWIRRSRCYRRRSFTWAILCVGCRSLRMLEARYYLYLFLADPGPRISSFFSRVGSHLSSSHPLRPGCPFPILASSPLPSPVPSSFILYHLGSFLASSHLPTTQLLSIRNRPHQHDIPSIPMMPE